MHIGGSLLLFWGSIFLGYAARRARFVTPAFAPRFIRFMASWIAPPVVLSAMWAVDFTRLTLVSLPFVGLAVAAASAAPAIWLGRRWRLPGPRYGSWLVAALFSNVGFLGALVAFAAWGEEAYGLCTLFFLFFGVVVYTVGYAVGDRYGAHRSEAALAQRQLELWRWTPMAGTLVGMGLSWAEVPRPLLLAAVNQALIPLMTGLYLFTVGTTLHLSRVRMFVREGLWMSVIKLVYAPLVGALLGWALGYHRMMDGLVFRITVLESAMPTAITSLTLPALFRLDQDFANSLWVITTLCSMVVIPLLFWLF